MTGKQQSYSLVEPLKTLYRVSIKRQFTKMYTALYSKCGVIKVSISILNTNNTEYTLDYSIVSRDNNRQVVGDVSKCLDTTETDNYQVN